MEPILLKSPVELPPADEPVRLPPSQPIELTWEQNANLATSDPSGQVAAGPSAVEDERPADAEVLLKSSETVTLPEAPPDQVVLGPARGPLGQVAELISWMSSRLFGAVMLIVGLSFLAAYPVVQIFSLGYLLEAAGRIGRSGRLRDGFPLVKEASRIGGALLCSWLVTLPWRFAGDLLADSTLIDSASPQTAFLDGLVVALTILTPLHILFAVLRGGRIRYFFWPFNFVWFVRRVFQGGYFQQAWAGTVAMFRELHVLHYFYLGLRGGLGALIWLAIPATIYAVGSSANKAPAAVADGQQSGAQALPIDHASPSAAADDTGIIVLRVLIGGLLLSVVVLYLPFLQAHFAAENRFRAMFEVGKVRERFRRAPIAFLIAFVFTLLLALPLYLLKIEVVPRDALWLPSLIFIVTIFPLKVMTGWAYGRAGRKEKRAHWIFRVACRLLMLPVAMFYALIVFFTQYTGWHGVRALYEHHAFLLPVAF